MPTLQWLTREEDLKTAAKTPCRLLAEEENYSYGDPDSENIIVQGDNLEALKALLPFYAGQVKCIYIDPPYNTGSAFEHYDDNMEHTKWLSMIYPRLELLKQFLVENGSIWISIDADECHYLKIICDEIFGRKNFIDEITWQRAYAPINLKKTLSRSTDTILVYAKNFDENYSLNKLPRTEEQNKDYKNPDNDPRGVWKVGNPSVGPAVEKNIYEIISPSGRKMLPPSGRSWLYTQERFQELLEDNRIWWGKDGNNVWAPKMFLSEVRDGVVAMTLWTYQEVGHNQDAKKEIKTLFENDVFATPKPEQLIQRILTLATNPGDLVLDSFLGSGTTAAVAHKMGRRYIGIEMGEQAKTHCVVRLKKVIDGEQGGISEAVGWKGGGGFRFFKLGETVFDSEGRIKSDISFENLASHIYFTETKTPMRKSKKKSAFLGIHHDTAYALLYNGENVLTHNTLNHIIYDIDAASKKSGEPLSYSTLVIYGEATRLTSVSLKSHNIIFKQTPYDIKVW